MPRDFSRTDRISEQIQRDLAVIFQREVKDPRVGMLTVNGVKISKDLSIADIYISFLSFEENADVSAALTALKQASGFIRSKLAGSMRMRSIPQLRFHHDTTVSKGRHLSDLIDKAVSNNTGEQKQHPAGDNREA